MAGTERLVVIGNGMAGARVVEEIVQRDGLERFSITVFGDEPRGNYNRILLSGVLAGSEAADGIYLNPIAWYERHGVTLHAGQRVTRIDPAQKTVTAGELTVAYDKLVIATGSSAFVPPMDGVRDGDGRLREGVFVFRTLDDCSALIECAERARVAAVIGGGLLGLEAARGLMERGLEVHVVHLMPGLMDAQLDPPASQLLRETLEAMGLIIHTEKLTTAVLGDEQVTGLRFRDGTMIAADMLVVAAGIRPNTALAAEAGLYLRRGIVVGDDLACQDQPDIYAVGECAEHRGLVYGLVAPAWEQARILAERLCGRDPQAVYLGSRVATKLKVMGVDVAVMGDKEPAQETDEVVNYVEPARGIYKKLIIRENRLVGAILVGDSSAAGRLIQAFDRAEPLPADRAELLFPIATAPGADVASLPASTQICNCNGVSKGDLEAAVRAGHTSLVACCGATRAGTGCGSCKSTVQAIIERCAGGMPTDDPAVHYYVPGVPLSKPELVEKVKEFELRSVSAVFNALAGGRDDPASKPGLASLLKTIWGAEYEDERDSRFINDRVHANIQNNGTFSVVPRLYGGVVTAAELRRIADVAERYEVPLIKLTGGQRIDLLGIPKAQLPDIWRELDLPSGHAYTKAVRTCKTCVGTGFCRFGVGDSIGLGIQLERRLQGLETPHKVKMATAGCPRNCSEAYVKDIGAVAIEGGRWEIYIGGAAGSRIRKGDLLCVVEAHDEAVRVMGRFLQYYREQAKYLERTYDFVERVGVDALRRLLVDDAEGLCAGLDAALQASVDAHRDPWQERDVPAVANQFADLIPVGQITAAERERKLADATPCAVSELGDEA